MFSARQKREISAAVQKILRETDHPELPAGEISFHLHVDGAEPWSWADIKNNAAVAVPTVNPFNELAVEPCVETGPQPRAEDVTKYSFTSGTGTEPGEVEG